MADNLTPKQQEFVKAFRSGKYPYLCAAGTTGSGKSFITLGLLHLLCTQISGLKFAVIRKSEKNLKQTSIPSYEKVKRKTKTIGSSRITDLVAKYYNTSQIHFIWADIGKDPECNNIRGLEFDGFLIEEGNQVDKKYFDILKTRLERESLKIPPFIMINLNPSLGWVKDEFYDPYTEGTLSSKKFFIEFNANDVQDLIDGGEVGRTYLKNLEDLPEEEYKRFVANVWDYSEIPNQLIKYEWYKQCAIESEPVVNINQRGMIALDPAWEGDDDTVIARMHGQHIGWFESYPKQDPDISGTLTIERANEFRIKANEIIVDPIGIGAASVCKMRNDHKTFPDLFLGGDAPVNIEGFLEMYNKRSEAHWILRELLRREEITITHSEALRKQCLSVRYIVDDKKVKILPKKDIKKDIGISPGLLDVAMMLAHKYKTTSGNVQQDLMSQRKNNRMKDTTLSRAEKERAAQRKRARISAR